MALTMMALGPFRFGLDTAAYQTLEQETEYRWVSQARIGRHPASQFIGEGHTTINLDGVILTTFRGGLGQMDTLRELARLGRPQFLVSGLGRNFKRYTIDRIRNVNTVFLPGGAPRRIEFSVALTSYGED